MSNTIKQDILRLPNITRSPRVRRTNLSTLEAVQYNPDGDQWQSEQHGEEHRYSRSQRQNTAKKAYQAAANLAHQKVTHAPFYMEDIGQPMEAKETKT